MLSFFTFIIVALIGLMMGTIYKRSFSDLQILRFKPSRVAYIFSVTALIFALICGFLSYKAILAFSAKDALPEDKAHFFEDYQSMLVFFLSIGFILMIIFSNLHSFASKKISWVFYLQAYGFYAAFSVMDNFFLQDTFIHFKKVNQLWEGGFSFASIAGYIGLIVPAGLAVFNGYMTYWGLKK
jgi:hypothetical protein